MKAGDTGKSSTGGDVVPIDVSQLEADEFNRALIAAMQSSDAPIEVRGCSGQDRIGPGLQHGERVSFHGSLGDFCLCGVKNTEIEVHGEVGCGFAESLRSGAIVVRGNAGDALGAYVRDGLVAVQGTIERRVAAGMDGGEILIDGSVGAQAGYAMRSGTLVIVGNAGPNLGEGMRGGTIYLQGECESAAKQLEESRFRESDRLRIGLMFLKAGFENRGKSYRVFRLSQRGET